jgi:hypothetical protein
MSRYFAGRMKLNKKTLSKIEKDVKPSIYSKISELGIISNWDVTYGYDVACLYFLQFKKVTIDDFEGEEVIDIDYLFNGLNGREMGWILNYFFPDNIMVKSHASLCFLGCEF